MISRDEIFSVPLKLRADMDKKAAKMRSKCDNLKMSCALFKTLFCDITKKIFQKLSKKGT